MSLEVGLAIAAAATLVLSAVSNKRKSTYVRRAVLTDTELRFFFRLLDAVSEGDYVCPQLGMAAALETRGGTAKSSLAAFRAISQKRIDFCICDRRMMPKLVVELDDHTHDAARDAERDDLLRWAGIRTLRFDVRRMPTTPQLRAALVAANAGGSQ